MKREEVKTGMTFINNKVVDKVLYVIEANNKYIECLKIEDQRVGVLTKIFRIGSDWDRMMENYFIVKRSYCIEELFRWKE